MMMMMMMMRQAIENFCSFTIWNEPNNKKKILSLFPSRCSSPSPTSSLFLFLPKFGWSVYMVCMLLLLLLYGEYLDWPSFFSFKKFFFFGSLFFLSFSFFLISPDKKIRLSGVKVCRNFWNIFLQQEWWWWWTDRQKIRTFSACVGSIFFREIFLYLSKTKKIPPFKTGIFFFFFEIEMTVKKF